MNVNLMTYRQAYDLGLQEGHKDSPVNYQDGVARFNACHCYIQRAKMIEAYSEGFNDASVAANGW